MVCKRRLVALGPLQPDRADESNLPRKEADIFRIQAGASASTVWRRDGEAMRAKTPTYKQPGTRFLQCGWPKYALVAHQPTLPGCPACPILLCSLRRQNRLGPGLRVGRGMFTAGTEYRSSLAKADVCYPAEPRDLTHSGANGERQIHGRTRRFSMFPPAMRIADLSDRIPLVNITLAAVRVVKRSDLLYSPRRADSVRQSPATKVFHAIFRLFLSHRIAPENQALRFRTTSMLLLTLKKVAVAGLRHLYKLRH